MTTLRNLTPWIMVLSATTVSSAQQFERLVSTASPRVVNLHTGGLDSFHRAADYAPRLPVSTHVRTDPYGVAPVSLAANYGYGVPAANRAVLPGSCCGPRCGTGYPYPVSHVQYGYPASYPTWNNYGYGSVYDDGYYGRNLLGRPTRYDRDEPVRNILRWLLP